MQRFADKLNNLQLNKVLIVLRNCGSVWQKGFIKGLEKKRAVVDLADPLTREGAQNYPEQFIGSMEKPALIYNLQRVPELLPLLAKAKVPKGSFIAVTEQSYYLLAKLQQDEAGVEQTMEAKQLPSGASLAVVELPLEEGEEPAFVPSLASLQTKQPKNVLECVVQGSLFKQEGAQRKQPQAFYAAYIKRIVQQQIMEQTTVSDDIKFYRFLCMAASMTGTVVNYSRLASTVGITAPTAKQWLQFLAGTGVVYLLQPLEKVGSKRLVKAPKLYFRDTGMAAQLLQLDDGISVMKSVYCKNLLENYVVNQIRESYLQQGEVPQLLFYKDSNYKEISLILCAEGKVYPMAITKDEVSLRKLYKDFQLLAPFAEEQGLELTKGCIIGLGKSEAVLENGIVYIPAEKV